MYLKSRDGIRTLNIFHVDFFVDIYFNHLHDLVLVHNNTINNIIVFIIFMNSSC